MEQPFLPGEVSILVLRYLASIGCDDTARCFFKEFPSLREFLQAQNRGCETPRGFEAPQVLGSLGDILYDYGRAKLIMKNIVVKLLNDWQALSEDSISPCDTLATQLRQIGTLLGQTFSNEIRFSSSSCGSSVAMLPPPPKVMQDADTQTVAVIRTKRVATTCTTLDIPESESQNIVMTSFKRMSDGETQTTPVAEMDTEPIFGQSDNEMEAVPFMFYNNMLNNTGPQEIIASNTNKQIAAAGTQSEKNTVLDSERKSYSTPRKKKHVRNLLFTTPPKGDDASSSKYNLTQRDMREEPQDLSKSVPLTRKRKAKCITEPKSRKRLDLVFEDPKPKSDVNKEPPASKKSSRKQKSLGKDTLPSISASIESVIRTSQSVRSNASVVSQNLGKAGKLETLPKKCGQEAPLRKSGQLDAQPRKSGQIEAQPRKSGQFEAQPRKSGQFEAQPKKTTPHSPQTGKIAPVDDIHKKEPNVAKGRGGSTSKHTKILVNPPFAQKQATKRKSRRSEQESALKTVGDTAIPLGYISPSKIRIFQPPNKTDPKLLCQKSNDIPNPLATRPVQIIRSKLNSIPHLSPLPRLISPLRPNTPEFRYLKPNVFSRPPTPCTRRNLGDAGDSVEPIDGPIPLDFGNNGLYPINLLSSSPMPTGRPRTPGRQSPNESSPRLYFNASGVGVLAECSPVPSPSLPSLLSQESYRNEHERCAVTSTSRDSTREETSPMYSGDANRNSTPSPHNFNLT